MKKLFVLLCICMAVLFTGCKTSYTDSQLESAATLAGKAAAYALKFVPSVDADVQAKLASVLEQLKNYVPASGQTYESTWNALLVDKVADKLPGAIADRIMPLITKLVTSTAKCLDTFIQTRLGDSASADRVNLCVVSFINGMLSVLDSATAQSLESLKDNATFEQMQKLLADQKLLP